MDVTGADCMTRGRQLRDRTYDNGKVFWWTLEFVHVDQGRTHLAALVQSRHDGNRARGAIVSESGPQP